MRVPKANHWYLGTSYFAPNSIPAIEVNEKNVFLGILAADNGEGDESRTYFLGIPAANAGEETLDTLTAEGRSSFIANR